MQQLTVIGAVMKTTSLLGQLVVVEIEIQAIIMIPVGDKDDALWKSNRTQQQVPL